MTLTVAKMGMITALLAVTVGACKRDENAPPVKTPSATGLVFFEPGEIERRVDQAVGSTGGSCGRVGRSARGDRLYCYRSRDVAIVANSGSVKVLPSPGLVSFLGDPGQFVAWTRDIGAGVTLANGSVLAGAGFRTDPSGEYFVVRRDGKALVGRIREPQRTLVTSSMTATGLFEQDGTLYLFGAKGSMNPLLCEIYRASQGGYELETDIPIERPTAGPSPFVVVDFEPSSGRVLLRKSRDGNVPQWYLFSLGTHELVRVRESLGHGLFLGTKSTPWVLR